MEPTTHHIEVFRSGGSWATGEFSVEGFQVSEECAYHHHKTDAIKEARAMAGGIFPIRVYSAAGDHIRTINKGCE